MAPLPQHRASRLLALATPVALMLTPPRTPPDARPADAPLADAPLTVHANPNVERAGVLRDGVLTVALEARRSAWQLDGPGRPAETVEAFSEPGREPTVPGPFVRTSAGTMIRFSVHNALAVPLTFLVPSTIHGVRDLGARDSIVVAPGATGVLATRAEAPGDYMYRAKTTDRANLVNGMAGALGGAIVIDSVGATVPEHDRVFAIMATEDATSVACDDTTSNNPLTECSGRRFVYTINGMSWPRTERVHATVGDSLHWHVINLSGQVHPMHLHGFYYRVDRYAGEPRPDGDPGPEPGQMVVTQLMLPYSAMSLTWSPTRPGNWLFHCHIAGHTSSDALMAPGDPEMGGMGGLMIGTIVAPRRGAVTSAVRAPERELRLVAIAERALSGASSQAELPAGSGLPPCALCPASYPDLPRMHFVLEEQGRRIDTRTDMSPEIDLVRGEPVAITIVNHLARPASVHWHGIEIEDSYMDGAAGFSGEGAHVTPEIAPGDSFVAHFAPPRAGTFMYHTHVDEVPEEIAGMEGALIVHDLGSAEAPDDHFFFLKGQLRNPEHPVDINGQPDPDTVVLHVSRPARFRLMNLASISTPAPTFSLTARPDSAATLPRDTMVVRWVPVAKDAYAIPASRQTPRPAREIVAVGETYDFEFTPRQPGTLQLEVRGSRPPHPLLTRVPIRVQ